jgi:hypothetical protein
MAPAVWPRAARAQQSERARRIGVLETSADDRNAKARQAAFRDRLRQLGFALLAVYPIYRTREQHMTATLEDRIRAIEDRLEIYNLIASHPPSADTGGAEHIASCWVDDGVFDRGENLSSARGRDALAAQVSSPEHQAAIAGGLAHFTGLPHVAIDGDTAVVTSYLQILVPQTQGEPVAVPNHGSGKGFRVFRMTANRWELLRTPQGWKFKHRSSRQLDGSEGARKILRGALRA